MMNPNPPELRQITYPELMRKLKPFVEGWPWGEAALRDLWLKGIPNPTDKCPGNKPCKAYPVCDHIRRYIRPTMFAEWWQEAGDRMGAELGAHILED